MRLHRRGIVWLLVAAVVLAGLAALVVFRVPIAQVVGGRVLAWRGIDADFQVRTLDFDRAVVERLALGPDAAPSVAARRIEARFTPWGLVRGRVRELAADGLEIRVAVDAGGVRLEGLPTGGGDGGGGPDRPVRAPHISIPDARLYVATPAGELVGDVALVGGPDEGWSARVAAQPATLAQGQAALELLSGALEGTVRDQALTVSGEVRLASLSHAGATARDVTADLEFAGRYEDAARLAGLAGEGAARFGVGAAALDAETAAAWAGLLAPATSGATEEALGPHLDALRALLSAALREASARAEFSVVVADGEAVITPAGEPAITAASGARLAVGAASDGGGSIVVDSAGAIVVQGLSVSADFADQLDARAIVSEATLRRGRDSASGEAALTLALAPWTAEGLTLGADVQRLQLGFEGGVWRAQTKAELRATGDRFGVQVEDLVAGLDLEAIRDGGGVAVRPSAEATQQLTAASLTAAGQRFESVAGGVTPLAPDRPLLSVGAQGVSIATRLSDLSAGLEMAGLRWAAVLPAAEFVVSPQADGASDLRVYVQAPRFEGRDDDSAAVVQASVVEGGLTFGAAPSVRLRFEGLSVGGSALPVAVARAAGEIDATLVDGRPHEGRLALAGFELADAAERDRVVPLVVSADIPITDGVLNGAATALGPAGRTIITAQVRHDFAGGAGTLSVATPRFVFAQNGFQPHQVFPILQGPIVNTSGAASLETGFTWDPDGVTSRGALVLENVAFDMRFGHVDGLSTRFEVADLLGARTDAPQRITVGLIDPGVPLADGSIDVELLGQRRMRLAAARFPFANGVITAAPAEIEYAAERKLVILLAQSVSLDALGEMFKPPNVVMTGSLSGRLPIEARDRSVYIVDGELVSDAPGRISYTGRAGEGIAQQNESTKLAFDALTNFRYDRLTLTLDGDVAGRIEAGVRLEGRNPEVLEGYPINFNLNTSAEFANLLTQAFRGLSLNAAARGAEIESAPP